MEHIWNIYGTSPIRYRYDGGTNLSRTNKYTNIFIIFDLISLFLIK